MRQVIADGSRNAKIAAQCRHSDPPSRAADVVRLLRSLPYGGRLSIHLAPRARTALDGMFSLSGLETVRGWPTPANGRMPAKPNKCGVR
jgi:hypothetical protein